MTENYTMYTEGKTKGRIKTDTDRRKKKGKEKEKKNNKRLAFL